MSEVTKWEDMSELEQLISEYSDQYKECNGMRPTFNPDVTVESLKEAIASLDRCMGLDAQWEREFEQKVRNERRKEDHKYKEADTRFAALYKLKG